jgi:serine/threonine-protein kinase
MLEVVKAEIPDVRQLNEAVDTQAAAILAKMLAKDPHDRFQNCHDLAAALQAHPLVAQTGALKLPAAKPAASDATVVGAPTPASQPKRAPTPPPVVSAAGVGVATPAPASAPPPVHLQPRLRRLPMPPPAPARRRVHPCWKRRSAAAAANWPSASPPVSPCWSPAACSLSARR